MRNKRSSRKRNPSTRKKARSDPQLTAQDKTIMWELSAIDANGQWGWNQVNCTFFFKNIWKKMRGFETMTWDEILGTNHHAIAVRDIITPAQKRLQELGHDDVDELVSFRLTGKQRLWAIRLRNESRLLWWDPNHEICPSHKRHT